MSTNDEQTLHFAEVGDVPDRTACGVPLLRARVDFRRGVFLRSTAPCPTCAAVARAYCPEVEA